MKHKPVTRLKWGLFGYNKKHFWLAMKDIKILTKRVFFTLKHGYTPQAKWETFAWFIDFAREIIVYYRYHRESTPMNYSIYDKEIDALSNEEIYKLNEEKYNQDLDKMLLCLDRMDELNPEYDDIDFTECSKSMNEAKDEFFKLFSKYFYDFWD